MFIIASALFIKTTKITESALKALFWCFSFFADFMLIIAVLVSIGLIT